MVVSFYSRQMFQLHFIRKCVTLLSPYFTVTPHKKLWCIICSFYNIQISVSIYLQQPAKNALTDMRTFLDKNPSEIITIFIEDYVTSPQGLTKVFQASEINKYLFPLSRMPKDGGDWPTVDDMIQKNQRFVAFTSKSNKEASEGIAFQWKYVVENQCELPALETYMHVLIALISLQ